jgi:hypothetical protein
MIGYLVFNGIGVWGNNVPVGWGWPIVNFVFWIGIGHAGTLISAVLFLFRQKWRTSINRASEAMTIFAVMAAGIFPAIHVGRIWVIYWVFPLPNQMSMWPNFKSPLLWDVFAVSTYFTISALFWFVGLVPDLATFRDRAAKAGRTGRRARLRRVRARLARQQPPLDPLREGLPDPGRPEHAARAVGALDRLVRLRRVVAARLAHHDLPALLRRGRHLLGVRHGADPDDPGAAVARLAPADHAEPPRQHREDPAA